MMPALWSGCSPVLLAAYACSDGFDFGSACALRGRKTRDERDTLLAARPGCGTATKSTWSRRRHRCSAPFPVLYATAFSGFYLPLMIVLWLLLFRSLGIELRHHIDNLLWHHLWDVRFQRLVLRS